MPKIFYSPFDRLSYEVDPRTGCWNWTKSVNKSNGYGYLTVDHVVRTAHTYSYELHRGPIPEGKHIDHLCRNRRCINPDHMEPVSPGENCRRGINTRLTEQQAKEIRGLYRTIPTTTIAEMFGISKGYVRNIAIGIRWGEHGARKKAESASKKRKRQNQCA